MGKFVEGYGGSCLVYFVLDIGGSSIKFALVDKNMNIVIRDSWAVPGSFDGLIELIQKKFNQIKHDYECAGIAISAPGSVDSFEGVIYGASAIPYIHGPNFKEILGEQLGLPIEIENDANCAALAEAHLGDYSNYKMISSVVIGSGVGGSNVYNGEILRGANLHGGEFGYMILDEDGFGFQTMSTLSSVGGIVRQAQMMGLNVNNGKELFSLADSNEMAQRLIDDFFKYLAIGLFNIQYSFDPDVILIGGAISNRPNLIERIGLELDSILNKHESATLKPVVRKATFGNDSNILGAVVNFKLRREK